MEHYPRIISGGASLVTGGLFDHKPEDKSWKAPHCGHRDGRTIDLSILHMKTNQLDVLSRVLKEAGFDFNVPGERPGDAVNHWHMELKK